MTTRKRSKTAAPDTPATPSFDASTSVATLPRLLDALSDAVVLVDRVGRVISANRRFRETLGHDQTILEGRTCPRGGQCASARLEGTNACVACEIAITGEPRRMIQVVPDAHGQQRRWEATLNPVLDGDGQVEMVVEVWRDVTERTRLEAQLSHSERLASLGMLAAGVAHEINNPLASIFVCAESLERWLERTHLPEVESAEARELLRLLERECQRCRETTEKLGLLGQPYATRPVWIDLNRAVRDTLALLAFATRRQHVQVAAELDEHLPQVWGREGGLRGVLMNLCMNAVQALANGGHLTVRTQDLGDGRVRIEVRDDGPGIAPEHLDRIWDPFFTTKPVGQGTGLGLSITQRIVARHGGTVEVASTPGQGACFVVVLPTEGSGGESA